jgi:crotonobetainyl-CoA:carnitine CoA-transferase CaiB-like acyl-CoA transferase
MSLAGVRVVDRTRGVAGPYCTKLLADAGADVVFLEPPGGADERRLGTGGLFAFLHTSKRSATVGQDPELTQGADIVVADQHFDAVAARRAAPRQVVVTISPFGVTGPWAGRPATEFTLQASCGSTGGRGLPSETPLAAGGQLGEWLAGTYAAVAAVAALREARRSGCGDHLDVAMLDCMAVSMVTFPSLFAEFAAACGHRPPAGASRTIEVPSVEPSADGWVNFTTNSAQQFSDFAQLMGHPELAEDPRFTRAGPRFTHRDEFWPLVHAYTEPRTSSQIIEEAGLLRIPVAPVLHGGNVMDFEQFVARDVFVAHPSGRFRQPRVPYRITGVDTPEFAPAPDPGHDDGAIGWPAPIRGVESTGWRMPLQGVRVVDLTAWWAGPSATNTLAGLGADVVKVESTRRPDLMRFASTCSPDQPNWWEWGPLFHAANTNKRGVTIDLVRSEGQALVSQLLATADLVVENYTPRVMDQFGLAWEDVHRLNPALCMVRMPAFGLDGPWRDRPGFAQTMESLTGLAWLTGHPDGPPTLVRGAGDPLGGLHAALAALIALSWRDDDGGGRMVEATMVESVLNAAAEQSIDWQLTGDVMSRRGNRSQGDTVPQGVYACASDEWIAVAVESDRQWRSLCAINGDPSLDSSVPSELAGTDLSHVDARRAHHDAIDRWISSLTGAADAADLVEQLVDAGIPAAVVIKPSAITDNPQLRHRGLFETEVHPVTGNHHVPGLPFRSERVHRWIRIPSPTLGQHNDEVLAEVGVAPGELELLRDARVIGETLDPR